MARAISVGARKRRSTKPSRTPFRRPIRFQSSSRPRAGALLVPDPSFKGRDTHPKAPGIIKFFQANEVLRRETGYHTCPLGAGSRCGGPYSPFAAHRHSVAHGLVAAERDNKKDIEP